VAKALGQDLFAVRLDTPGSRRGDFNKIMEEVRWELDLRGFNNVKLFLSGGLDEYQILNFNKFADAYGVGTAISNAPVIDFSMDIVEIEGEPLAKRGKRSGSKSVFRCKGCADTRVIPAGQRIGSCKCGGDFEEILTRALSKGEIITPLSEPGEIRDFVIKQLENIEL